MSITKQTFLCILFLIGFGALPAQGDIAIPSTNLSLPAASGCTLNEADNSLYCDQFAVSFIQVDGVDFSEEKHDFANIEEDYAKKGVEVVSKRAGELGSYEALFLHVRGVKEMYQIVFGNEHFFAFANVMLLDTLSNEVQQSIVSTLGRIKYKTSYLSPLQEHAKFRFDPSGTDMRFVTYNGMIFGFENTKTEDALMIFQFPVAAKTEGLAFILDQMFSSLSEKGMSVEIMEEGELSTSSFEGLYRIGNTPPKEHQAKSDITQVALFITSTPDAVLLFQYLFQSEEPVNRQTLKNNLQAFFRKEP